MNCFRTVSFQKVVKHDAYYNKQTLGFRTVSFQKVVKHKDITTLFAVGFRTVSFQKVVKLPKTDLQP